MNEHTRAYNNAMAQRALRTQGCVCDGKLVGGKGHRITHRLIQEENDGGIQEKLVVADGFKERQALVNPVHILQQKQSFAFRQESV